MPAVLAMAACPFYGILGRWTECAAWTGAAIVLGGVLYLTWYRNLPARDEV